MKSSRKQEVNMIVTISVLTLLVFSVFATKETFALAQSYNVALVPSKYGAMNGGSLPTAGFPGGFAPIFTNLDPNSIMNDPTDPIAAGNFDTVVFMQIDFIQNALSNAVFKSRIDNFVFNGGKLIIWDSETMYNDYTSFVFSNLPEGNLAFTVNTPGPQGANQGDLWIVENNTLGTNDTASSSYLNTATFHDNVEIGDANVMVTQSPNWCTHMVAKNVLGVEGPVQTYARYGRGLVIYNGLDTDNMYDGQVIANDGDGVHNLGYIWYLQLLQQWNPDNLPCGVKTAGLTLSPHNSTNTVGTMHTVTATVSDNLANPVPNCTVTFTIVSGPNVGLSGSGYTDIAGQTSFSWTSTNTGTDTVNATAHCPFKPNVTIYDTATKTWTPKPWIPMHVEIHPETLNLKSKGTCITCLIYLPAGYDVHNINPSTIRLNNTIPAAERPVSFGSSLMMVKFDRAMVQNLILSQGIMSGDVILTVTAQLYDGTTFQGSDIMRVIMPGDVNGDLIVDIRDILLSGQRFGSTLSQLNWNPGADQNEDGRVDLRDFCYVAIYFGTNYK